MQIQRTQIYHFDEVAERTRIETVFGVAGKKKLCKELLAVLDLIVSGDFQSAYEKAKTWDRAKLEYLHPMVWDVLMATSKAKDPAQYPNTPTYRVLEDSATTQPPCATSDAAQAGQLFTESEKEKIRDCIREALAGMKFGHNITTSKVVIYQEPSAKSLVTTFKMEIEDKILQNEVLIGKISEAGIRKETFFECIDAGVNEAMGELDHVAKRDVLSVTRSSKKFPNAMNELITQLSDQIIKIIGQAVEPVAEAF